MQYLTIRDPPFKIALQPTSCKPLGNRKLSGTKEFGQIILTVAFPQTETSAYLFRFALDRVIAASNTCTRPQFAGDPAHRANAGVFFQQADLLRRPANMAPQG